MIPHGWRSNRAPFAPLRPTPASPGPPPPLPAPGHLQAPWPVVGMPVPRGPLPTLRILAAAPRIPRPSPPRVQGPWIPLPSRLDLPALPGPQSRALDPGRLHPLPPIYPLRRPYPRILRPLPPKGPQAHPARTLDTRGHPTAARLPKGPLMPNLCPVCQTPIRKNAKLCTLHAAEHGMQYAVSVREHRHEKSPNLCRLPGCRNKRRPKGIYCSDKHCRAHFYQLQKAKDPEGTRSRQRQAAAKYRRSIGIKPRRTAV